MSCDTSWCRKGYFPRPNLTVGFLKPAPNREPINWLHTLATELVPLQVIHQVEQSISYLGGTLRKIFNNFVYFFVRRCIWSEY
jgi:hypothetical protein